MMPPHLSSLRTQGPIITGVRDHGGMVLQLIATIDFSGYGSLGSQGRRWKDT